MVRGAEVAQAYVRLGDEPLDESFGDARLSDPRLARRQDDAACAIFRLLPAAKQKIDLPQLLKWAASRRSSHPRRKNKDQPSATEHLHPNLLKGPYPVLA